MQGGAPQAMLGYIVEECPERRLEICSTGGQSDSLPTFWAGQGIHKINFTNEARPGASAETASGAFSTPYIKGWVEIEGENQAAGSSF
jgi:hypothetical protein